MRLPALQLPLSDIEASEFAGITTKKMQSKVYQLPSQASSTTRLGYWSLGLQALGFRGLGVFGFRVLEFRV